ncbi:uncharacterized protein K444DRAFT_621191 [Hyaloscypha bicolor E]|uniref:Uncharacterized protein n=1 Tax=Hyaloscypha bicolor E TaxID=1095630 RepID=A0A2J6SMT0_9HELO|nr:uncharacterized protein K444DRAFT_621191 [Hyaloscypha bicolor E]PMD52063.1 hypothetical protein K444DRAFT_621191 [Hyaloscypha bicolor E]
MSVKPTDITSSQQADKREEGGLLSGITGMLPTKTWGVGNIEKAYSRAGASNHHTPGSASRLGSQDQGGNVHEHQGVGSAKFAERFSDQRREPTVIGKMFNNMINGTDKTK